jgi:hypothetical protein
MTLPPLDAFAGVPPPASGATSTGRIPGAPFLTYGAMPVLAQREANEIEELRRQACCGGQAKHHHRDGRLISPSDEAECRSQAVDGLRRHGPLRSCPPSAILAGGGSGTGGSILSVVLAAWLSLAGVARKCVVYNHHVPSTAHLFGLGLYPWAGPCVPGHDTRFPAKAAAAGA